MKKRVSILVVMALVCVLSLVACGGKEDKQVSGDNTETSNKVSAAKDQGEGLYTETGQYPIVNEQIELKFLTVDIPEIIDIETNEFTQYMEEKTNIKINWDFAPSENKNEKLNLLLASGVYPDVFYGLDIKDDMEAQYGVEQGVFRPLNDLIENHMPNFKENVFNKFDNVKGRITAVDGSIYALPEWNECYHCYYALKFWMNQEWLDNLGLQAPTTTDELYTVLKAFKENDPNGNGLADEIPLTGSDAWNGDVVPFLMNAFILHPSYGDGTCIVKDDKVMTIVNTDEYKEGLKYIKKLYDEGLISEGSFIQKADQLKQIAANAEAEILGSFPGGFSGLIIDPATNPDRYRKFSAVAPIEGPNGVRQTTKFEGGVYPGKFLISSTCEYPEAAARWADVLYTAEGEDHRSGRIYGRDYVDAKEGAVTEKGEPAEFEMITPYTTEPQNRGYFNLGIEYVPAEGRKYAADPDLDMYSPEGLGKLLNFETDDKYKPYENSNAFRMPNFKMYAEESEELQVIKVELKKYIEESQLKFLIGEWNFESDWETYKEGLISIGLERFLEINQTAYERQYK